jgi:pimeloyl-ACP methyl ester carboxylesterase
MQVAVHSASQRMHLKLDLACDINLVRHVTTYNITAIEAFQTVLPTGHAIIDQRNMSSRPSKLPPPLPPRQSSNISNISTPASEDAPPSYDSIALGLTAKGPWSSGDPRSSSQQSLVPSDSDPQHGRRKLLLIYIHGFMGNETSFRSFPAHVHHLLTVLVAETHVVHTKIYPRYRSKRNISFARDDFSRWLEPHEDPMTDVILLGHSMGGLLAAEVALMPPPPPASRPLKHRILGTINFDVPFLGMHPGVIRSGLASIFMPAEETHEDQYSPKLRPTDSNAGGGPSGTIALQGSPPARTDTLFTPQREDPNFNPSFSNDVILPVRKGWQNAWHFVTKHSGDLRTATVRLVSSHMEFGGAMANYGELKARYARIRALEEEDEVVRRSIIKDGQTPPRIRFVNYYTASTGKVKNPKPVTPGRAEESRSGSLDPSILTRSRDSSFAPSSLASPRLSLEQYGSDGSITKGEPIPDDDPLERNDWQDAAESLTLQEPTPMDDEPDQLEASSSSPVSPTSTLSKAITLPPIPDPPQPPPPLDTSYIGDKDTRKLVEKEHARAVKAYEKAIKDRQKAINDRAKLEEKLEKKAKKEAEKAQKDLQKARRKAEEEQLEEVEKVKLEAEREMTHQEREELRLDKERQRMEAAGRRLRGEPEPEKHELTMKSLTTCPEEKMPAPTTTDPATENTNLTRRLDGKSDMVDSASKGKGTAHQSKPKKDRKFCTLPPKDSDGLRDPCWVRVFMENVDEVGAHCGLFFVDERYERLVGDVAGRVESWVRQRGWDGKD